MSQRIVTYTSSTLFPKFSFSLSTRSILTFYSPITFFHYDCAQAWFISGSWTLQSTPNFSVGLRAEICILSVCIASHRQVCKRPWPDRPWLSQCVAGYRSCGVGQMLAALWWKWNVCVAVGQFPSWLHLCFLLLRSRIGEGVVDACAAVWWADVTWTWAVACRLASSIWPSVFHRALDLLHKWLRHWAPFGTSCTRNICWLLWCKLFTILLSHRPSHLLRLKVGVKNWRGILYCAFSSLQSLHVNLVSF